MLISTMDAHSATLTIELVRMRDHAAVAAPPADAKLNVRSDDCIISAFTSSSPMRPSLIQKVGDSAYVSTSLANSATPLAKQTASAMTTGR